MIYLPSGTELGMEAPEDQEDGKVSILELFLNARMNPSGTELIIEGPEELDMSDSG